MTASSDNPSQKPPRETPLAAAAFHEYAEMGMKPGSRRSLAKLAEVLGKPRGYVGQLERWSATFDWQRRVKAFDAAIAEDRRLKREADLDEMNARHATLAREQAEKAIAQIEKLIDTKNFGSQASVQLLKLSIDLERLARGAATERLEASGPDGTPFQVGFYPVMLPKKNENEEEDDGANTVN